MKEIRFPLILRLLCNVYERTIWESGFEVGEDLVEPWDSLINVEISNVFYNAVVDDE